MFLTSKPKYSVAIKLDNDRVFLNGDADVAENTKLDGMLVVTSSAATSPVTIHLSFLCNLLIKSKDLFGLNNDQVLFRMNWKFQCHFDFNQESNTLNFPFSVKLPGDLPASMNLDDLRISYQFKAFEKSQIKQTTLATKQISIHRLARIPRDGFVFDHAHMPPTLARTKGTIGSEGMYKLKYPDVWYSMDEPMPINLNLKLLPTTQIHSITYSIRQAIDMNLLKRNSLVNKSNFNYQLSTYNAHTTKSPKDKRSTVTKSDIVSRCITDDDFVSFKLSTELSPCAVSQKKFGQFTSTNYEFSVTHYLLAQVTVIDLTNGNYQQELIRCPITLLPRPRIQESKVQNPPPPTYQEAMAR